MASIRRILVAVKEPAARTTPAAVKKAMQLARALGARLELFHAITAPLYADTFIYSDRSFPDITRAAQAQAEKRLQALATRFQGHGRGRPKISVAAEWDAPAYEAVIRRARASKADLIVAERHAGRHFAPGLLHLNDWELLRLSPVPVLLVKKSRLYDRPAVLAAVDPGRSHGKPASLDVKILAVADAVSKALRGRLFAVHAYVRVPGGDAAASINARMSAGARQRFQRTLARVRIPASRRLLIAGSPVDAIARAASSTRSGIVVMGAVSRSGLRRWILDDTAEGLLDQLSCDLLIVKPPRFESDIARRPTGVRLIPAMPLNP
jgi:universal stress protein E